VSIPCHSCGAVRPSELSLIWVWPGAPLGEVRGEATSGEVPGKLVTPPRSRAEADGELRAETSAVASENDGPLLTRLGPAIPRMVARLLCDGEVSMRKPWRIRSSRSRSSIAAILGRSDCWRSKSARSSSRVGAVERVWDSPGMSVRAGREGAGAIGGVAWRETDVHAVHCTTGSKSATAQRNECYGAPRQEGNSPGSLLVPEA
jgi:hypothetical protein